jgi:adenylate cyclase
MAAAPERKLTTILAADVAGYSAMMGRDEPGTLAQLKSSREAMAEEIAQHRGRIFGASGDNLLAEFSSVVNAVECAVRVQRTLAERNAALPEERRMRFRIGINLGDVMVEGDDLFGEGVNIAARLEALAEPGGILISGAVFDQVRTKLSVGFDFLGAQAVKNISEPVPAWRVVLDGEGGASSRGEKAPPTRADEGILHASDGRKPTGAASPHPPTRAEAEDGRQAPASASAGEGPPASPTPSPHGGGKALPWQRLRRPATFAAVLIAFFFLINISTSTEELWFRWPALVILLVLGLRAAWIMGR